MNRPPPGLKIVPLLFIAFIGVKVYFKKKSEKEKAFK